MILIVDITHVGSSRDGGAIEHFIEIRHFILVLRGNIYSLFLQHLYVSEIILEE